MFPLAYLATGRSLVPNQEKKDALPLVNPKELSIRSMSELELFQQRSAVQCSAAVQHRLSNTHVHIEMPWPVLERRPSITLLHVHSYMILVMHTDQPALSSFAPAHEHGE